ncbi:MAG: hypothetical protein GWO20_01845 [Candidatus Korarchaeota archaeon]|nr:hypothetical protein [Candidatus Korarchaeota archaeon]NIU82261.1 hypothetical protein [Candidatus Thorarchaeota archaeon]NIW12715.1 hypothetical protein [Candidatus Thorarchaeota archaeon]NIW50926.1 hypothetical protein [Candidatus Korarchaeota archaeon]
MKKKEIHDVFLFTSPNQKSLERLPEIEDVIEDQGLNLIGKAEVFRDEEAEFDKSNEADLIVSLGGDGTILRISKVIDNLPVLGVNTGQIGFLTEVQPEEFEDAIKKIIEGDFRTEETRRLGASVTYPTGEEETLPTALNEHLLTSKRQGKILHLQLALNGIPIAKWRGDGAILASALGSTAYSLSEGGSVLLPTMDAFIFTPLVPLWRKMRPVVLSEAERIKITLLERGWDGIVVSDGSVEHSLPKGSSISVWLSTRTNTFLRIKHQFYGLTKLFTFI